MSDKNSHRLVKAIYVYDDGSTAERNWPDGFRNNNPVTEIARNEEGSVREYSAHYQVFLRVDKGNREALLPSEIFNTAVNILTRLLVLNRKLREKQTSIKIKHT